MADKIPKETIQRLHAAPLTIEMSATQMIDMICDQAAHPMGQEALLEPAAHRSTQHDDERLVKPSQAR
jgi:hypothetical protein